ncbi:MAG: hypothetical protein A3K19_32570 [Lentisphaerae bacterium RIFOXYB12_FULL_65_16]|nr:MAG: hypothetical protein A3K18_07995 [Lentisphaerae bacterium RIFOXYA12_64_32]OGV84432.1 MAG: hypothetical protein A3K19_32570 [Lentisphaerae bacterium RIFOXYB12_FULL_65_16]
MAAQTTTIDIGRRETMPEAVARALIRYIAQRGLKGGDRLPSERELVAMIGVSRLPLREALCILKGLGIIEARHGKGIFVKPMDMASIFAMLSPLLRTQADMEPQHIMQTRLCFEPTIAEIAAAQRDPEDLRVLADCLQGMRDNVDRKSVFVEHDMAFHQQLAAATGNPVFRVFMAALADLLREVQFLFPDRPAYRRASLGYHADILAAVETSDGASAAAGMRRHLQNVEERI